MLAAASRAKAPLGNSCRGQGICQSCAILVVTGAQLLEPAGPAEQKIGLPEGWRVACLTRVRADTGEGQSIELWTPAWGGWPDPGGE